MILAAIAKRLEGVHMVFLQKVMGKTARRNWDGMWKREGVAIVLSKAETQTLGEYIDLRNSTVAEWVVLRPIYAVCEKEKG